MKNNPNKPETIPGFSKHELLFSIIKALNSDKNEGDSVRNIIKCIKDHTGFDAIAIRIKKNNDYPYYSTDGFSSSFVETEKYLLPENCIIHSPGNLHAHNLECICGLILSGEPCSDLPGFTEYGSFRINDPSEIKNSGITNNTARSFRLNCIKEGYNSIALIPVRTVNEIIGLLQINDRRPGVMDNDTVFFFESLCSALGPAISRKSIDSAIYETNMNLETIIEERTIELLRTIRDKDRLLNEVNHRIKNNLLIISNLLSLQVMKESDKFIKDALNNALIRINSMGIIHQTLYSSSNLDHINIEQYILSLYNRLLIAYGINREDSELMLNCCGITVNIDTAIPCGLIINEIISNSIRHAYIPGKKLVLFIEINYFDDIYKVLISDNGPGLKPGFSIDNDARLGIELIRALVKQLDGTLEFYNNEGLTLEIIINIEHKEEKRWKQKTF